MNVSCVRLLEVMGEFQIVPPFAVAASFVAYWLAILKMLHSLSPAVVFLNLTLFF